MTTALKTLLIRTESATSVTPAKDALAEGFMGDDILYALVPMEGIRDLLDRLKEANDKQSADLVKTIVRALSKEMTLKPGASEALTRLQIMVTRGTSWDAAMLRNNVFKAADSLGMKLPSAMF